ncbi:MAG TPA: tetratricopeptide repeat protein [Rubrivivax sp.]|nr:tetratricopeptide repeat protein [Rubrivivax sp.]
MATQLDLQEQEQLDALKAFWNKHGDLITWTLVLVLGAFAAWNGWNWWQREQAAKAGALFEELDKAATAADAEKAARVFADLKERYPRTAFAQQGGLLASKVQATKGQGDAAQASLAWVAEHAVEEEARTIARLRLAALQADAKQYDAALKTLEAVKQAEFTALAADRRGDILQAQGKPDQARSAYQMAYAGIGDKVDYRRLVEAKLTALAAPPGLAASAAAPATQVASGAAK